MRRLDISSKRLRVLVIAEAANPEWTSVPLIGWKLSHALRKVVDVHLVTQMRNRDAILQQGYVEGVDFTAIDNEAFARRLFKLAKLFGGRSGKGWTTRTAFATFAYYSFERELWHQFSGRFSAGEFDLVHRVTPLSPTAPSILAKRLARIGIPFVLGPLNGGLPWPQGFRNVQYAEREWLSHLRRLYMFLPGYRSTRKYSSAIIVGSKHTYSEMPDWAVHKCVYIPENAVDASLLDLGPFRAGRGPLAAAFVGRLVPYKGADILIEAAAEFVRANELRLHVIGDGPQRAILERLIALYGLQSGVELHGWMVHSDAQKVLRSCDVMVLPSIREFGGGVVIEAMAQGVTPIVADYGGPAELVDELTGIKIQFTDRESLVRGLKNELQNLIRAPEQLDSFRRAAQHKVRSNLTWDAKATQIMRVYQSVLKEDEELSCLPGPAGGSSDAFTPSSISSGLSKD